MNPYAMTMHSKVLKSSGAKFAAGKQSGAILTIPNRQIKRDFLEEFNDAVTNHFIEDKTPLKMFGEQTLYLSLEFASILMQDPHADFSRLDELNQMAAKTNPITEFFNTPKEVKLKRNDGDDVPINLFLKL